MNDPLISLDGKRSRRCSWAEFDVYRQSIDVSYWKRIEHRNGTETILIQGHTYKGQQVRLAATYEI